MDDDGLLLHAELAIGNATIMFGERKPDWAGDAAAGGAEEWDQASPELTYIHQTLLTAMRQLQDPR